MCKEPGQAYAGIVRVDTRGRATYPGSISTGSLIVAGLSLLYGSGVSYAQDRPTRPSDQSSAESAAPGSSPTAEAPGDIIVTATRRESTLQKTSGSISAISGDQIIARGFNDFTKLASTIPALSFTSGGPGQTEFNLRGVSSPGGNSPTVGFYLDDTPLTAAARSNSGKVVIDPALYDISRVEVLRGPQGTLFGSSSLGGTIRIITNQPDPSRFESSGNVRLSGTDGGGFNHGVNAMVNLPLSADKVALRIVGTETKTSGWVDRIVVAPGAFPNFSGTTRGDVAGAPVARTYSGVNNSQLYTGRAILLIKPVEELSITPSIFYQKITQGGPSAFDTRPGTTANYQPFDVAEPYNERFLLGNLNVRYDAGSVDLTSNTAYFDRRQRLQQDSTEIFQVIFGNPSVYGLGPVVSRAKDTTKQFTQEVRLSSAGDTRFKWLVGGFYSDLKSIGSNYFIVPAAAAAFGTANIFSRDQPYRIQQGAAFGEASYQITPHLKATAGVRVFKYNTKVTTFTSGFISSSGNDSITVTSNEASDKGISPKFDLSYIPNNDLTLYATAGKGFRPGGGNQPIPTSGSALADSCRASLATLGRTSSPLQYGSDSVWSYEAGAKSRLFDRRLTSNASAYRIDWSGIQQGVSLSCGFSFTANASDARIYGGELEAHAILAEGLTFDGSLGYIHGRIVNAAPGSGSKKGDQLQTVPELTTNLGVSYKHQLNDNYALNFHAENNFVGKRFNLAFESLTPTPSYSITNARVSLSADRWTATVFADNVFNKRAVLAYVQQQLANIPQFDRATVNQPLTAGVELNLKF